MKYASSISATKISAFLNNFDVYGMDTAKVVEYAGVDSLVLSSPDNRLSGLEVKMIIEAATNLTGDDNLGLHQGERLAKGFSNILGYVLMNCSALEECWTKYCRYEKLIDSLSESHFKIVDNYAVLSNTTVEKLLKDNRQFSDFKIAGMLSYIKLLSNKTLQIDEVHFTHSKPENASEYDRIFQCEVCFKKSTNALIFKRDLLNIPIIEPNKNLLFVFERNTEEILQSLNNQHTYAGRVSKIVLEEIDLGNFPSIETVAKKLLLSVRSLQLYLQKENTTYMKLIREFRKKTAEKYLKDINISIDEIAFILGFSETSAFHRAFKSWTGLTPVQFRNSILD
ncbi:MAG: AraC family transcriptional regulator [Bacillota bacterium]|nr:AraC family transcriptional regulator [Bacillota bacterium]